MQKKEKYLISLTPPTFIPVTNRANASDATGSKLIFNGEVRGEANADIIGTFNQLCTATKIVANFSEPKAEIQENICDYNFCLAGRRGCLFLRSGGPFVFDPFSTQPNDVPNIEAYIIVGTGNSVKYNGGAKIVTADRTVGGTGDGAYEFTLFYKRKRKRDYVAKLE